MWHIEMVEGQRGFILVGGSMALKTIGSIASTVLGRKELTNGTKLRLVNALLTLTYGCEARALQAKHRGQIHVTQMGIVGMLQLDRVKRNMNILGYLSQVRWIL